MSLKDIKVLMCFCLSFAELPSHPLHRELNVFTQRGMQKGVRMPMPSCSDPAGYKLLYCKSRQAAMAHLLSLYLHLSMQYAFSSSLRFINDSLGI